MIARQAWTSDRCGLSSLYTAAFPVQEPRHRENHGDHVVKPEEIKKLDAYFKRTFSPQMAVKARPRKNDSAEVYLGEEFLGVVYIDDEDGDRSYNFSMAILDVDL
jgi:hypothetical protein